MRRCSGVFRRRHFRRRAFCCHPLDWCAAAATPTSTPSAAAASSGIRLAGLFLGRGPRLRRLHLNRLDCRRCRRRRRCRALVRPWSRRLWLARGTGARPILDDAFERPCAPLVEIHPARQRLQPHLEIAILDADPRQLQHQVVHELVIEHVDFVALLRLVTEKLELRLEQRVYPGLLVDRVNQRVRIEEELQDGVEQAAYGAQNPRWVPYSISASKPVLSSGSIWNGSSFTSRTRLN